MPRDEQDFVGYFSSIPTDVKKYSQEVADYSRDLADSVERHFDTVAASIRQTLQTTPWIPDSIKPPAPPPVHRPQPLLPLSYIGRAQSWISRNRAITAAIVAFVGTGTFIIWYRRRSYRQKRRARRAASGARTQVVILAGSPHSPLTRSLAEDLERRGFIVYIPVSTLIEEQAVHSELRADIHPLNLDITSPSSTADTLAKFSYSLAHPPRHGSSTSHTLRLASIIIIPAYPSTHPAGPITTLTPSDWSDTLNTHLLHPFSFLQAFLPLILSQSTSSQLSKIQPPTLLLLNPSIPSSLHPANHAPESLTTTALSSYFRTLRSEIAPSVLTITTIKLGAFDFFHPSRSQLALYRSAKYGQSQSSPSARGVGESIAHTPSQSPPPTFHSIKSIFNPIERSGSEKYRAKELRDLHNGVFDAVVGRRTGVVFVGRGSWAYDFVGRWVPGGVVGWMMRRNEGKAISGKGDGFGTGPGLEESEMWEKVDDGGEREDRQAETRAYD